MHNFSISKIKEDSPTLNIPGRLSSLKDMVSLSPLATLACLLDIKDSFCHVLSKEPPTQGQKLRLEQSCKPSPAQGLLHCAAFCSHASVYNQKQDQGQFMYLFVCKLGDIFRCIQLHVGGRQRLKMCFFPG